MNKIIFNENNKRLSACGKPFLFPVVWNTESNATSYVPYGGSMKKCFSQRRKDAVENQPLNYLKKTYLYN
jgi:hypothetical protein